MKTELVKGFKDITGEQAEKRALILDVIKSTFEKYNFEKAETPIVEYEEFVKGDNSNDEAISDIFKLNDKGKRKLALRYELTFQLKRIAKNKKLPYKRYQIGPVFRDEPTQGNRFRQFTQCDVDVIGSSIKDEAEVLVVTKQILDELKIKSTIYVNNRKLLNEILKDLKVGNFKEVIKEIDKLDKLPASEVKKNLKKYNAEKLLDIIKKPESYFKKYKSYKEIIELKKYCKYYGLNVKFSPSLARGLSYYNGSVFEIKSNIKETICGGGSYMINGNQSTGISLGVERLELVSKIKSEKEKYLIISLEKDKESISIADKLRKKGENVSIFYGKPSKALGFADSNNFSKAIFVGEKEIKSKKFKVKDLKTGKEKAIKI